MKNLVLIIISCFLLPMLFIGCVESYEATNRRQPRKEKLLAVERKQLTKDILYLERLKKDGHGKSNIEDDIAVRKRKLQEIEIALKTGFDKKNDSQSGLNLFFVKVKPKRSIQEPIYVREEIAPVPEKIEKKPYTSGRINATWAVVVGVSEYANNGQDGLSNLVYADDDAKAFANSLKQQGWSSSHIKLLTNEQATQRNVMIALESWLTKAGPDDMVVLFWSGHGFPDPADPEKVYFACYDTDIRIPATGYRMDKVRAAVEEIGVRNVVMLADTCHAGKLITRGDEKAIGITPYVNSLVKKRNVPKGWIFMVASDVDRKAIEDSSWSHGAFTHCLLKALNGAADGYQSAGAEDGTVTMGELRAFMNSAMPDETQRILGVAKRPTITTSTGDPGIWDLSLKAK